MADISLSQRDDLSQIITKVRSKKTELNPLYLRMDADIDLFNLEPYTLMDYNLKTIVKRVDNVTLNDPMTFANRVMSKINQATMSITLDDDTIADTSRDTILDFAYYALSKADKFLKAKRMGKVRNNLVKISALRGIVGARVLVWDEDNKIYWDVLPVDTRFAQWEYGREGLLWGNIETERSAASVKDEYPDASISWGKICRIWEYYDPHNHVIFVNHIPVKAEENPLGYVPIFIAPVGQAMTLKKPSERDSIKREGQTIYDGNRQTYLDNNKLASIWMTTAAYGFRPPMQRTAPANAPDLDDIPPEANQAYTGGGKIIDMGYSKLEPMPLKDVASSLPNMFGVLSSSKQRASFPDIEWGELTHPLSAVAITKLTDGNNQVLAGIVEALSDCYQFILNEFKNQAVKNNLDTGYNLDILKKDVEFKVEFFPTSPEEDIANLSIAAAARGIYDDDTIREQICKQRDEGKISKALDEQKVNTMYPELLAYRTAKEFEKDRPIEAQIILTKLAQEGLTNLIPKAEPTQPSVPPTIPTSPLKPLAPPAKVPGMPPMPDLGLAPGAQTGAGGSNFIPPAPGAPPNV